MTTLRTRSRTTPFKVWPLAALARISIVSWWLPALLFAGAVLGMTGCEHVRRVTYPPDFTYLTDDTVSSSMGQMARHVSRLETLLEDGPPGGQIDRDAVVFELRQLEAVASHLGAGPRVTNHLLIDAQIDRFGHDVAQARRAVEREPPNYFLVGQVTGNCSACHIRR